MSVLIKGMEMPISCAFCRFYGVYCYAKGDEDAHSTVPCPLVSVPPHGDLIDRDDIRKQIPSEELASRFAIENAYVVIPAERSEE